VTLTIETAYTSDLFENYRFSPLDCYCNNRLCNIVEKMTSPSVSSLSILRGYDPPGPMVVSFERGYHSHSSLCYSHSLREIIVTGLLLVSNCEITKITIHSNR